MVDNENGQSRAHPLSDFCSKQTRAVKTSVGEGAVRYVRKEERNILCT